MVHDIASEGGADFIVMEYVAGKTLDQLIPRKGMRLNEALKIAVQVADAMARAHEAGASCAGCGCAGQARAAFSPEGRQRAEKHGG